MEQKLENINNQINFLMNAGQQEAAQDLSPFLQEQLQPVKIDTGPPNTDLAIPDIQQAVHQSQLKALEIKEEIERASAEAIQKQENMRELEERIQSIEPIEQLQISQDAAPALDHT